eukprot:jgi/Chlat1/449/Chrsp103S00972
MAEAAAVATWGAEFRKLLRSLPPSSSVAGGSTGGQTQLVANGTDGANTTNSNDEKSKNSSSAATIRAKVDALLAHYSAQVPAQVAAGVLLGQGRALRRRGEFDLAQGACYSRVLAITSAHAGTPSRSTSPSSRARSRRPKPSMSETSRTQFHIQATFGQPQDWLW